MFLLPQHFQWQEIYFDDQLGFSSQVNAPYYYGFRHLDIDLVALENWQVVVSASGRTKNGTLFHLDEGEVVRLDIQAEENAELKKNLEKGQDVQLYLAFATNKPNTENISESSNTARHREFAKEVYDLHTGTQERPIVFKNLNGILTANNTRNLDYEYLPVVNLRLGSSANGPVPKISPDFFPPMTVTRSCDQARSKFSQMENELDSYLMSLITFLEMTGFNSSLFGDPESSERIFRYAELSQLRGWLVTHNQSSGVEPFAAYQKLCECIGKLALVDPMKERRVDYPMYQHENFFENLDWAWKRIRRCFVSNGDDSIREFQLKAEVLPTKSGDDIVMKCFIPSECFESDWSLFLGFNMGVANQSNRKMSRADAAKFFKYLQDQGRFYWKLGSHEKINDYFDKREEGVTWENADRQKHGLRKRSGWVYTDIIRNNPCWNAVERSGTLCLRIDQRNLRTPRSDLGTPNITVGIDNQNFQYAVSVWAVKNDD